MPPAVALVAHQHVGGLTFASALTTAQICFWLLQVRVDGSIQVRDGAWSAHVLVLVQANSSSVLQNQNAGFLHLNNFEYLMPSSDAEGSPRHVLLRGKEKHKVSRAEMLYSG